MKDQDTSNCAAPEPIDILWAAVNSYAVAIGGDPSSTDNKLERSRASTDVEDAAFAMGGDEPVLTSLLDMVDALPGNAGLTPVLHRIAETLGDHHERLSTFEEHHTDPDDTDTELHGLVSKATLEWRRWQASGDKEDRQAPPKELRAAMFALAGHVDGNQLPLPDKSPKSDEHPAPCSKIRWCSCGLPWIPAAGPFGTTEETECPGCVMRAMREREQDAAGPRHGCIDFDCNALVAKAAAEWRLYQQPDGNDRGCQFHGAMDALADHVCPSDGNAVTNEPAPSSKSGKPTDAAEEIARLTDECKRGRKYVQRLLVHIEELEK